MIEIVSGANTTAGWDESQKVYTTGHGRYHLDNYCHYLNGSVGAASEVTIKYAEYRGWRVCKICAGTKEN